MNEKTQPQFERVVALDVHPDSFTAALVRGPTPLAAVVEKVFNKVPVSQLENTQLIRPGGKVDRLLA